MRAAGPTVALALALAFGLPAAPVLAEGPSEDEIARARDALEQVCARRPGLCEEILRPLPAGAPCRARGSCIGEIVDGAAEACRLRPATPSCAGFVQLVEIFAGAGPDFEPAGPLGPGLLPTPADGSGDGAVGQRLRAPAAADPADPAGDAAAAEDAAGDAAGDTADEAGTATGGKTVGRWLKPPQ